MCFVVFIIRLLFILTNPAAKNCEYSRVTNYNDSLIRQNILQDILATYDKRYPPYYNDDKSVEVEVQMYVLTVFDIDEAEMAFSMSMFLRQRWTDPRLAFYAPGIKDIELDNSIKHDIWVPDLAFTSDTKAYLHDITLPNKMMILHPNGYVSYSIRVTGRFTCFMELQRYPFDEQNCTIDLESYGYTGSIIRFKWASPGMIYKKGIKHSQFEIGEPVAFTMYMQYASGNYSQLGVSIPFRRRYGFYLIQIYGPSILVVMLSWMSFWLSIDATPARISLGILTVLTISTNGNLSVGMGQRVSYVRAIDIWNSTCLLLVFGTVLEYAYICVAVRVHQRRREGFLHSQRKLHDVNGLTKKVQSQTESKDDIGIFKIEKARTLEKISRIGFPVAFLIFNLVYWIYYLT